MGKRGTRKVGDSGPQAEQALLAAKQNCRNWTARPQLRTGACLTLQTGRPEGVLAVLHPAPPHVTALVLLSLALALAALKAVIVVLLQGRQVDVQPAHGRRAMISLLMLPALAGRSYLRNNLRRWLSLHAHQ